MKTNLWSQINNFLFIWNGNWEQINNFGWGGGGGGGGAGVEAEEKCLLFSQEWKKRIEKERKKRMKKKPNKTKTHKNETAITELSKKWELSKKCHL